MSKIATAKNLFFIGLMSAFYQDLMTCSFGIVMKIGARTRKMITILGVRPHIKKTLTNSIQNNYINTITEKINLSVNKFRLYSSKKTTWSMKSPDNATNWIWKLLSKTLNFMLISILGLLKNKNQLPLSSDWKEYKILIIISKFTWNCLQNFLTNKW